MASSMVTRLRLLSAAPWFDEPTATDLLKLASDSNALGNEEPIPSLRDLRLSGVLVHRGAASRVVEPLRSELRSSLYAEDEDLYVRALRVFVQHAQNGLAPSLTAVMGSHGSWLNIKALATVANSNDNDAFGELVDRIQNSQIRSTSDLASDAARLIERYAFKTDRRTDFLNGLALWNKGQRVSATLHFERVLVDRRLDTAGAISGHLVGVTRYSEGDLGPAIDLLTQSVQDLRSLGDMSGLAMTLTSLGRAHREVFRTHKSAEDLILALRVLEEAVDLSSPGSVGRGRALTALAQCYQDADDPERGLRVAEEAVKLLPVGDDALAARTTVALIYRRLGNQDAYEEALESAAEYAEKQDVGDVQLSRLLNMLAASRRRAGDLDGARESARRSLQMGRRMNDQRHIAHAAHTLAAINLDSLPDDLVARRRRLLEIERLLHESRTILAGLKNTYGIEMVDETLRRYYAEASYSAPTSPAAAAPEEAAATVGETDAPGVE